MAMTQKEHHAICAVIKALSVPRNRMGKLDQSLSAETAHANRDLQEIVRLTPGIPHGGADVVDQAVMVLQSIVGMRPTSIEDMRPISLPKQDAKSGDENGSACLRWEPAPGRGNSGCDETADFHLIKGGGGRMRVVMRRTKRAAKPFDLVWNGDHLGEFATMEDAKVFAQEKVDDQGGVL